VRGGFSFPQQTRFWPVVFLHVFWQFFGFLLHLRAFPDLLCLSWFASVRLVTKLLFSSSFFYYCCQVGSLLHPVFFSPFFLVEEMAFFKGLTNPISFPHLFMRVLKHHLLFQFFLSPRDFMQVPAGHFLLAALVKDLTTVFRVLSLLLRRVWSSHFLIKILLFPLWILFFRRSQLLLFFPHQNTLLCSISGTRLWGATKFVCRFGPGGVFLSGCFGVFRSSLPTVRCFSP